MIVNQLLFINICIAEAEVHGISLLHGNSVAFFILFEEVFREIYRYWATYDVEKGKVVAIVSDKLLNQEPFYVILK